jgi:biopolymer transport protein ExbD
MDEYLVKAKQAASQDPSPEVNLRADKRVMYDIVAQVLSASKRSGLTKLGFVTENP